MYTVPPQYHGYADPNPSPHLANADQLMDNVFVGAPQPKGMQKVLKRVNKTVHKMGKRDPGSGTDDSDFEYQHVEDDHEVKRAERGKKAKAKHRKSVSSVGIEDLIPTQEEIAASSEKPSKKSTKTKKKKSSSRKFQSDPLMYQHDSLAVDEEDLARPPQPPPHNPYMLYPTHVPFGAHQTPYDYYFMQREMMQRHNAEYWRQQEYQQAQAQQQQPRRKKDKNFAYISPGDNAFYTSPEEHQRKQYEKMLGQQRQPGSWDGIIDPTQDQEYGFRPNYNPWFGAPMGHALGGVPMQQPEPPRHEPREQERDYSEETSTHVTGDTEYTERTGSSGSGSGSGSGSEGSEMRLATAQANKRNLFPNFGSFIPPPSQDEKVSRFSAKNIFGKRTVSESRESLVSRGETETSQSRDSDSHDSGSTTSSHHPLPVPPSPGSYVSTSTYFSLNEEPIRPQSSVSQRGMMMPPVQRGMTPYNVGGEYAMPETPPPAPAESHVSASEEHSRALYNVWTGLTSTVKDWVSSHDENSNVKSGAVADNFFSQVYKNAFGQPMEVADNYSDTSSYIPQEIPLPEDPSDDDEFDARSVMEEDTVIGEIPAAGGTPIIYEEDIENRNKKRLKKTMKFLLRKKGKNGMPVVVEAPDGASIDEQSVPIGAVLKFRRSPLRSLSGSSRPTSSGSAQASLISLPPPESAGSAGSAGAAGSIVVPGSAGSVGSVKSAGSVSSVPPPPDASNVQKILFQLAVYAERLQPHLDQVGTLVRSHPVGATFMYPMDVAVVVHPKLKFIALGIELVVLLCALYVVASVVSSILTVLRFLFAPLIWILGIGAKKK
ncbi:hypothetical protein CJU90_0299 [Yarrowia sp. C11]|nr:hypothetical protein CKK34_1710 [Yarrowia sp. E02]KAG5372650.1 hypothetical protein CJU90_0299 [Yarrowia sp. C11]